MKVYAETNFVLELVSEQDESVAANELLGEATAGHIELVIPAFSLIEPYDTLYRREREAAAMQEDARRVLKQIERTAPLANAAATLRGDLDALLPQAAQQNWTRYETVTRDLAKRCRIMPLSSDIVVDAHQHAGTFDLDLPDAVVLASLLADLATATAPSIFVNKNSRDFDDPAIRQLLEAKDCSLINKIAAAVARVKAAARPAPKA